LFFDFFIRYMPVWWFLVRINTNKAAINAKDMHSLFAPCFNNLLFP